MSSANPTTTAAGPAFGSLFPTEVTLTIPADFTPPTTCYPTTVAATYSAGEGYMVYEGRLLLQPLATQCYPTGLEHLGISNSTTTVIDSTQTNTILQETAPYYAATTCPPGFEGRHSTDLQSTRTVQCCPSGSYSVAPVIQDFSGCILAPTAPVTIISSGVTSTLASATGEAYGISFHALPIAFAIDHAASSDVSTSSSGLSAGDKAGIGVGVGIGVPLLFLIGLGAWMFTRRRSRARAAANPDVAEVSGEGRPIHEATGEQNSYAAHQAELGSGDYKEDVHAPVELPGDFYGVEAPAKEKVVELPGSKIA